MSIARVTTVTKSLKPYTCGKCREELPKGSTYRWYKVGFRTRYRSIRCMKPECTPRNSELDGSKMATVWDAQESFEDALSSAGCKSDIESALEEYAGAVREVGEEYREAGTDDNGTEWSPDSIERADTLESAADEIESIDLSDVELKKQCVDCEGETEIECETCSGEGQLEDPENEGETLDCDACSGTGKIDCSACDGEGTVDADDNDEPDDEAMEQLRDAARAALEVDLP
jgi:hypothetical protein